MLTLLTACEVASTQTAPAPSGVPPAATAAPTATPVPTQMPSPTPMPTPSASPTPSPTHSVTHMTDEPEMERVYDKTNIDKLFSWNPADYTYHPIIGPDKYKLATELTAYKPMADVKPEEKPIDLLGFLAKCDGGSKENYYVTETQLYSKERGVLNATVEQCKALHDLAKAKNAENAANAQWLQYMSPQKLTEVSFSGLSPDRSRDIDFVTADIMIMDTVARKLGHLIIKPNSTKRADGRASFDVPATLMTVKLTFDSGVVYDVYITDSLMTVMSSDMSYSLFYTLFSNDVGENFRRGMESTYYFRLHPELELPAHLTPNPDT